MAALCLGSKPDRGELTYGGGEDRVEGEHAVVNDCDASKTNESEEAMVEEQRGMGSRCGTSESRQSSKKVGGTAQSLGVLPKRQQPTLDDPANDETKPTPFSPSLLAALGNNVLKGKLQVEN